MPSNKLIVIFQMDHNKAVQSIDTNLAGDDGVDIHTSDIAIQEKEVEVGPFRFTGPSPTLTINGGVFTELQVLLQYFTGNLSSKNHQEVIFQDNFVPVIVGSEICLDSNLYQNSDQTVFAFCGANPHDNDLDIYLYKCFAIVLDCSNLKFYSIPVQNLRFEPCPKDLQEAVLDNIQSLSTWMTHLHSNNLPLGDFGYTLKKRRGENAEISLPKRQSYRRPSAVAARKKIFEQSPKKANQEVNRTKHDRLRNKKKIFSPAQKAPAAECTCINEVKKLSHLFASLLKTTEKQASNIMALDSSVKDLKSTLAAAVTELKTAKKQKLESNCSKAKTISEPQTIPRKPPPNDSTNATVSAEHDAFKSM